MFPPMGPPPGIMNLLHEERRQNLIAAAAPFRLHPWVVRLARAVLDRARGAVEPVKGAQTRAGDCLRVGQTEPSADDVVGIPRSEPCLHVRWASGFEGIERMGRVTIRLGPGTMTVDEVMALCEELAGLGIQHLIVNMPNPHEIEPLRRLGAEIIPYARQLPTAPTAISHRA